MKAASLWAKISELGFVSDGPKWRENFVGALCVTVKLESKVGRAVGVQEKLVAQRLHEFTLTLCFLSDFLPKRT